MPIKLCETAGSLHLFKIKGALKSGDIKLNNYLWDTLEIDWNGVTVTFNNNKIELPRIVAIKIWGKIKVRRLMNRQPLNFHMMIRQGITWFNLEGRNTRSSINQNLHFRIACLLQPECNFLHGYFRCQLPIEVVDIEVKITSMQGTHIFRRDRTMQLIKCTPWNTRLCPHPTIIKKMKTFLEVEGNVGLIPQPTSSQYRPPQLDTNPKVRKDNAAEKRKKAVPTKRFRPSTAPKPGETAMQSLQLFPSFQKLWRIGPHP